MSLLRVIAENPDILEKLPKYEDKRKIKVKGVLPKTAVTKLVRAAQDVLMHLNSSSSDGGPLRKATISSEYDTYALPKTFTIPPNLIDRPKRSTSPLDAVLIEPPVQSGSMYLSELADVGHFVTFQIHPLHFLSGALIHRAPHTLLDVR